MTVFFREEEKYPASSEGQEYELVGDGFDAKAMTVAMVSLTGKREVVRPDFLDLVAALPKHPTLHYVRRSRGDITRLCIHHSAASASISVEQVARYHIAADPKRGKDAWPGIGYHFYIKPDGTIYQTNYLETVSYHVFQNNAYAVGICLAGDYTDAVPPERQLYATAHLCAWLSQELGIKVENIMGHREFPKNSTECPGRQWLGGKCWKYMLIDAVNLIMADDGPAYPLTPYPSPDLLQEIDKHLRAAWKDMQAHGYALSGDMWPPLVVESQEGLMSYHVAQAARLAQEGIG